MSILKTVVLTVLLLSGVASSADAIKIVDTGPGLNSTSGWTLFANQSLGAEFSIANNMALTDIEGWIYPRDGVGGTGHIGIYTDGGEIPGTELFSSQFDIISPDPDSPDWYGLNDLNWILGAGTY